MSIDALRVYIVLNSRLRYYIGWILIAYGFAQIPVAIVSIVYSEPYTLHYLLSTVVLVVVGYFVKGGEKPVELSTTESLYVAILSFLIPGLVNTVVMTIAGFDFWDSLFESISGITTTGLSMYSVDELPYTIHFVRAWLQWIGGVGIVVMTLVFLLKPGTLAYNLLTTHIRKEAYMPSVVYVARAVLAIYGLLTFLCGLLYYLSGMSVFDSIVHALTTISTGGFSTKSSFLEYSNTAVWVSIVFMFLSAQSFPRYYMMFRLRNPKYIWMGPQIKSFLVLLVVSTALFHGLTLLYTSISLQDSIFTVVSALTTTGYSTVSMDSLPDASKYILVVLMITGAALGSTGGGFKQYRLIVLFKELWRRIVKAVSPPGRVVNIRVGGQVVSDEEVFSCIAIVHLYIIALVLSTIAFLAAGYSFMDTLFSVASAIGTVGLAPSIVYHTLPWWSKLLLSIDMFIGRLEILPVIAVTIHALRK